MSGRLLKEVGEALYGQQWQSALARDLGMSDRHMRRLVAGDAELSAGMAMDIWRITLERIQMLSALSDRLKLASTPGGAPSG